jgi:hypothetical protein
MAANAQHRFYSAIPVGSITLMIDKLLILKGNMAERTGLEPATPGVTGRYSNQLNYRSDLGWPIFRDGGLERWPRVPAVNVTAAGHP